jgi:hypothetical protein
MEKSMHAKSANRIRRDLLMFQPPLSLDLYSSFIAHPRSAGKNNIRVIKSTWISMKKKRSKHRRQKRRIKVRLPLPKKSGGPMGTAKGKKGYDRKREKEEVKREEEQS